MVRPKTYHIILSDTKSAVSYKKTRNPKKEMSDLLELDEVSGTGLTHSQIAHTYAVCPATITIL